MFKIGQKVIVTAKATKWTGKIFEVVSYKGKKVECQNKNLITVFFEDDDLELCNTWK